MSRAKLTATDFWARVHKTASCWIWKGPLWHDGSGAASVDGVRERAHRTAWSLTHGDPGDGVPVLRSCTTKLCVNPAHMYLERISLEDAQVIREEYFRGQVTQTELAKRYNVDRTYISRIISGLLRAGHGEGGAA